MFPRLLLPAFFIGLAVASPWLVQDWLNGRTGEGESRVYEALSTFPERLRSKFDSTVSLASISDMTPPSLPEPSEQTGSSLPPYPVASKTKRLLQGLVPTSLLSSIGTDKLPSGAIEIPPSVRADAITERTRKRLEGELARLGFEHGEPIFIRIFKEEEELELWMRKKGESNFTLFKIYRIRHWSGQLGPKVANGDGQGPEGFYFAALSHFRPETRHHLGIDLGFPNEFDRYHGRTGSDIMIHGGDSSAGSFALDEVDMEEVYSLAAGAIGGGQEIFRVNAFPFRMTDKRMEQEWKRQPEWIDFWANLKEGYDFFENVNRPPDVKVRAGDYAFVIR